MTDSVANMEDKVYTLKKYVRESKNGQIDLKEISSCPSIMRKKNLFYNNKSNIFH